MASAEEVDDYEARLDAFFKLFSIPELHNIEELITAKAEWTALASAPIIGSKNNRTVPYTSPIDGRRSLIILTAAGIYEYDIRTNTSTQLCVFPEDFACRGAEVALSHSNGDLVMMGGFNKCFGIFNLESREWDLKCLGILDEPEKVRRYEINSADNEPKMIENTLYCKGWSDQRYYDAQNDIFVSLGSGDVFASSESPTSGDDTRRVFNAELGSVMQLGSVNTYGFTNELLNEIWCFGRTEDSTECEWRLSTVALPSVFSSMSLMHVLCAEKVMILVYFPKDERLSDENEVWCLDMADGEWAKGKASLGDVERDGYTLCLGHGGEVLRVSFVEGHSQNTHLKEICNVAMYEKYRNRADALVSGFAYEDEALRDCSELAAMLPVIQSYYTFFTQ